MGQEKVEAFILFNEKEEGVAEIVRALKERGVSTYFWDRDIEIGAEWVETENHMLREAGAVVVFLGNWGWGPTHLKLAEQALELKKRLVLVLIGRPDAGDLEKADGLFRDHRYLEMLEPSPAGLEELARAIRRVEHSRSGLVERLVNTLVNGSEDERDEALRQIRNNATLDRSELAARLREEVASNFAPSNESRFAQAKRAPKLVPSIRSWMLSSLIWADGESEKSRDLLLRHISPSFEPDRNVRFWVLAGLYQAKASYAAEAFKVGREDAEAEVSLLAWAAGSPGDDDVVRVLRERILSGDFETAWPALRVLRIVPVPDLAADVCRQLNQHESGTPFSYDALYALANPEMARAAAAVLEEDDGIGALVERVVIEVIGSNNNTARNFAGLLLALDEVHVGRELEAKLAVPATSDPARRVRRALNELRRQGAGAVHYVAGFTPDTINVADDRLDITEDVQTLAAIMLAKEVTPPLAIGLFGDWGSGKSFFMQSMKAAAEGLAARSNSPSVAFCSNIVSIEFNAWHYADTNLWASLVSYILEKLEEHVSPKQSEADAEPVLVKELSSAKALLAEVQSEKKNAEELIARRQDELQNLRLQREQKEVELSELRAPDLYALLGKEDKEALEKSLEDIGVPAALNSIADLSRVAAEAYTVRGRISAIFVSVLNGKNRRAAITLLALLLIVIPVGAYLLGKYINDFLAPVWGIGLEFAALVGGAMTVLRKALGRAKAGLKIIEDKRQRIEAVLAEKRKNPTEEEVKLGKEIAALSTRELDAASRLSAATARVQQLEERIRSISEGRSLARFLAERASSDDYRKHLGLISTIRRDFLSLGARLAGGQDGVDGLRRVDRIILYIDDLDRCPADKVMDVLQAVHLLLAYPLFVVVVGVDPRWLLHSLGQTYSAFEGNGKRFGADPEMWQTTPQNYLEKIFQIPFTLRRMSQHGYDRLIEKLFSPSTAPDNLSALTRADGVERRGGEGTGEDAHTLRPVVRPLGGEIQSRPDEQTQGTLPGANSDAGRSAAEREHARGEASGFVVSEESLVIRPWEVAFAERLFAFIPTPRAAKRFSNIYRLLKASVRGEDLPPFEGTTLLPGDFQIPMLLLAVMIGTPAEAAMLFPKLQRHAASGGEVTGALRDFGQLKLAAPLNALEEKIRPVVTDDRFPDNSAEFLKWIPRVSRFSFEIGRAVL